MDMYNKLKSICYYVLNDKYNSNEFMLYLETALIDNDEVQSYVDSIKYKLEMDMYTVLDDEMKLQRKKYAEDLLTFINLVHN